MYQLTPDPPNRPRRRPTTPVAPIAHPDFRHAEPADVDPSFLSTVHTQEIKARLSPGSSVHQTTYTSADPRNWGHSWNDYHRRRLLQVLPTTESATPSRIDRYKNCGTRAWVYYHTEGQPFRIHAACCKDRWCPTCQAKRAFILRTNLAQKVGQRQIRFMTLTLKATGASLSTRVNQLYAGTAALRRLPFWSEHVTGGAMFIELKWIATTRNWHVHAHLLIEGRFIPHHALKACWRAVTAGSTIVDIRMPKSQRQVEHYVTKYVTKPVPQNVIDDDDLLPEAIDALHRRRLCLTFGTWRGYRLLDTHKAGQCVAVMPLQQLIDLSHRDSGWAQQILNDIDLHMPATWELENWAQSLAEELFPCDPSPPLFKDQSCVASSP